MLDSFQSCRARDITVSVVGLLKVCKPKLFLSWKTFPEIYYHDLRTQNVERVVEIISESAKVL